MMVQAFRFIRPVCWLSLSVVMAALLVACSGGGGGSAGGGGGGAIEVKGSEFKFDPANVTVKNGQAASIKFDNTGAVDHTWTVRELNADTGNVASKQSKTITFTPSRTGSFDILCTVPGHSEAGMKGRITVQ